MSVYIYIYTYVYIYIYIYIFVIYVYVYTHITCESLSSLPLSLSLHFCRTAEFSNSILGSSTEDSRVWMKFQENSHIMLRSDGDVLVCTTASSMLNVAWICLKRIAGSWVEPPTDTATATEVLPTLPLALALLLKLLLLLPTVLLLLLLLPLASPSPAIVSSQAIRQGVPRPVEMCRVWHRSTHEACRIDCRNNQSM